MTLEDFGLSVFFFFVKEAVQCDFDGWQSFDLSTFIERVHVIINLIWERFIRRTHVLLQNVAKQSVRFFVVDEGVEIMFGTCYPTSVD